ncbi:hypothetical protein [Foetidibacter luteolus]|uniref:hypothetical protein n=1 Tax=Foetidibacter luteolus TaxID=2608880 RepID=UPI00129A4F8E|nr:hypothetical protein [Foetidibacter luteolus]
MKIKTRHVGKGDAQTDVTYRKLGKHAYLVSDKYLVIFNETPEGYQSSILAVSAVDANADAEYIKKISKSFNKLHKKMLEKLTAASAGETGAATTDTIEE